MEKVRLGRYARVSKREARKAYDRGATVWLCPVKLLPFSGWHPECALSKARIEHPVTGWAGEWTFDELVDNFASYNCTHETGYYPSYWVLTQ
jgi:hypothetical protein